MRRIHPSDQDGEFEQIMERLCQKGTELGKCVSDISDAFSTDEPKMAPELGGDWDILSKEFNSLVKATRQLATDARTHVKDLGPNGAFFQYLSQPASVTVPEKEKLKEVNTYAKGLRERDEQMRRTLGQWKSLSTNLAEFGVTADELRCPTELKDRIDKVANNLRELLLERASNTDTRTANVSFPGTMSSAGKLLSTEDYDALHKMIDGPKNANIQSLDGTGVFEGEHLTNQLDCLINVFRIMLLDISAVQGQVAGKVTNADVVDKAYRDRLHVVLNVYTHYAKSLEKFGTASSAMLPASS